VNLPSLLNIAIGGLPYLASDFIFAPPTGAIMRTEVEPFPNPRRMGWKGLGKRRKEHAPLWIGAIWIMWRRELAAS